MLAGNGKITKTTQLAQMDIRIEGKIFTPYIDETHIQQRIEEIAAEIREDYIDKNPVFIVILNGAFIFAADLLRACKMTAEIEFVKLKSYENMGSTGEVKMVLDLQVPIENRHIILVEDIIDTGQTLHSFSKYLKLFKPASVHLVSCLSKPEALQVELDMQTTIGFEIPNLFVIGYGLDLNGFGRQLKGVYQYAGLDETS